MHKSIFYETVGFGMGTVIEQKVKAGDLREGETVCKRVSAAINDLEQSMSFFLPGSSVSRLNTLGGEKDVPVDQDTLHVLKTAAEYYALSGGAFDITTAPLGALWRRCIKQRSLPENVEILRLLSLVSGSGVMIDDKNESVRLHKEQSVDLGGIGKGYAADAAVALYKQAGINSAFINLGGNVYALGQKADDVPWIIGLQDPRRKRGEIIAALKISDMSVVTSWDYEKYFEVGGKRYHHIIDPKTGCPALSDLMSATVLSHSSMQADALSTAVFVSGLEGGMELLEKSGQAQGVLVTKDKKVYITKGLKETFVIQNKTDDYRFYFYD
jgi:thiamine biosynthesis lipoprotein